MLNAAIGARRPWWMLVLRDVIFGNRRPLPRAAPQPGEGDRVHHPQQPDHLGILFSDPDRPRASAQLLAANEAATTGDLAPRVAKSGLVAVVSG